MNDFNSINQLLFKDKTNYIIDNLMNKLSGNELKFLLFLARQNDSELTYNNIVSSTGIRSHGTVSSVITSLIEKGYIVREEVGRHPQFDVPLYEYVVTLGIKYKYEQKHQNIKSNEFQESYIDKQIHNYGYVYLIQVGQYYKIGVSKDIHNRLKQLSTLPPFPVSILHTFFANPYRDAESILHEMFDDKRVNGEWFELLREDVDYILSIDSYIGNNNGCEFLLVEDGYSRSSYFIGFEDGLKNKKYDNPFVENSLCYNSYEIGFNNSHNV